MLLTLKFIGAMRQISKRSQQTFTLHDGNTLKGLICELSQEMPGIQSIFDSKQLSALNSNSLVLVNGKEISVLNGFETELMDGDQIVFIPVVHGG